MTLLFYEKDDYYDFKESREKGGYVIVSITKFLHNFSLINDLDIDKEIIDISAMTEYVKVQSIFEEVIGRFNEMPIFICDISKREALEYELRFVFDNFENVDKDSFIKKERNLTSSDEENSLISKRHRKVTDLTDSELIEFFNIFNSKLYGHSKFKDDFKEQVTTFKIFNRLGEHKILSFFLMGESGVGKTEVARNIFNSLNGKKKFAKINFGNYSNEFSLSSLIGSARGFIGSDDGEIFMKVRETDVGILLIDEFEKSNAALFNYFLEVLESGKMTSSMGEEIDLNGFIIVFTSNISKEDFKNRISPELRSRFDYKCIFTLLSDESKEKYVEFRAENISKKVHSEFQIEIGEQLKNYLLNVVNVSSYKNMRDINKQIKKEFLNYLKIYHAKQEGESNSEIETISNRIGFARRFLNIFNN